MIVCGTRSGYLRHWRRGERICAACREANRVYARDRRIARGEVLHPPYEKPCRHCGERFVPPQNHFAVYCSERCKHAARYWRSRERTSSE